MAESDFQVDQSSDFELPVKTVSTSSLLLLDYHALTNSHSEEGSCEEGCCTKAESGP